MNRLTFTIDEYNEIIWIQQNMNEDEGIVISEETTPYLFIRWSMMGDEFLEAIVKGVENSQEVYIDTNKGLERADLDEVGTAYLVVEDIDCMIIKDSIGRLLYTPIIEALPQGYSNKVTLEELVIAGWAHKVNFVVDGTPSNSLTQNFVRTNIDDSVYLSELFMEELSSFKYEGRSFDDLVINSTSDTNSEIHEFLKSGVITVLDLKQIWNLA